MVDEQARNSHAFIQSDNDNGIQGIGLGNQHNKISTVNESLVDELDLLM
jgi:hypothetical protein